MPSVRANKVCSAVGIETRNSHCLHECIYTIYHAQVKTFFNPPKIKMDGPDDMDENTRFKRLRHANTRDRRARMHLSDQ